MKRPQRKNYSSGTYEDDRYLRRLEAYCSYIENKNQALQLQQTGVSGSFSSNDVKWLLFYGYTKDKTVDLNTEQKGELDYFIEQMFETMKETSRFNIYMVKEAFWQRIEALANYR